MLMLLLATAVAAVVKAVIVVFVLDGARAAVVFVDFIV